jgi:osmotically-inducible protein OsmY
MRNTRVDDNIACRVTEALWSDPFVPASNICVHVLDGTVMLTGEVGSETERIAIGRLVADLICVERLTNAITVTEAVNRLAA